MDALPTGTVTFLFTDVEGSTRLWEEHPDAMRADLTRHDAIVESLAEQHHGCVVRPRGEGDSRFCVFARATDAVEGREAGEGLRGALAVGAEFWANRLRHILGQALYYRGDYAGAEAHLGHAAAADATAGDHDWLGHIARARGDYAGARAHYATALGYRRRYGVRLDYGFTLSGLAALGAAEGQYARGARLGGAAAALCESAGIGPARVQQAHFHELIAAAREGLGEAAFRAAWDAGRAMSLEQAVTYALSDGTA